MVRQYQVVLDPAKLRAYGITQAKVIEAIQRANQEAGGSVLELAESRVHGARLGLSARRSDDFRAIPLGVDAAGVPVRLGDVATRADWAGDAPRHRRAGRRRRGRRRRHRHALRQERAGDDRARSRPSSTSCKRSLPAGVEIVPTYDRSQLIERAVDNLTEKLIEEFVVVALVCCAVSVPPALGAGRDRLAAARRARGVHRHALPGRQREHHVAGRHRDRDRRHGRCGGRDDRERAQARLEAWGTRIPGEARWRDARWQVIREAAVEVGPALFFSPAHHHAVVHAGVHARGAGRAAVLAAGASPRPMRWRPPPGLRSRWSRC